MNENRCASKWTEVERLYYCCVLCLVYCFNDVNMNMCGCCAAVCILKFRGWLIIVILGVRHTHLATKIDECGNRELFWCVGTTIVYHNTATRVCLCIYHI